MCGMLRVREREREREREKGETVNKSSPPPPKKKNNYRVPGLSPVMTTLWVQPALSR